LTGRPSAALAWQKAAAAAWCANPANIELRSRLSATVFNNFKDSKMIQSNRPSAQAILALLADGNTLEVIRKLRAAGVHVAASGNLAEFVGNTFGLMDFIPNYASGVDESKVRATMEAMGGMPLVAEELLQRLVETEEVVQAEGRATGEQMMNSSGLFD
jgi:hypothetical protein